MAAAFDWQPLKLPPAYTPVGRIKSLRMGQAFRSGVDKVAPLDPHPLVKLFTPDAGATWLLTEIDPVDQDLAFGLCDLGLGMPELGYFRLSELASIRGPMGLLAERDLHYEADRRISTYASDARRAGRIQT